MQNQEKKQCPYCAETILLAAKKCKHCGSILDPALASLAEVRQAPSRDKNATLALELQTEQKSVTTAALLAMFVPALGAAYGSIGACLFGVAFCGFGFYLFVIGYPKDKPIALMIFSVGWLVSIFWSVSGASSHNRRVLERLKNESESDRS